MATHLAPLQPSRTQKPERPAFARQEAGCPLSNSRAKVSVFHKTKQRDMRPGLMKNIILTRKQMDFSVLTAHR